MIYPKTIPKDIFPILWSYDVTKLNPWRDRRPIIINTINYGDLKQWRWLVSSYSLDEIKQVIKHEHDTALRFKARKLFFLLFFRT